MARGHIVKITIGTGAFGGRVQDILGELEQGGKQSDIVIDIPLTRLSLSLLQRKSLINTNMTVTDASVDTKYKIQEIQRVVGKHLVRVSGTASE